MMLGSHIASSGGMVLFSETTFKTSKEKTKMNASEIPIARFAPSPPRFFCDESDKARIDSTMMETGMEVR